MSAKDWDKDDRAKLIVGGVSALFAVVTLGVLFYYVIWKDGVGGPANRWQGLAMLAVAVAIAACVGAVIRFALAPLISQISPATSADADAALRGRIAPLVLAIGTIAIASLTLVLIISFVTLAENPYFTDLRSKIDTLLTGTFATVLPVIATWVGTVLAFYFGSENFRQAAQSTREALGNLTPSKKASDIMTPYERIARLEVDDQDKAKSTPISDVINLMRPSCDSRNPL
jgi:Na+/serine symporter